MDSSDPKPGEQVGRHRLLNIIRGSITFILGALLVWDAAFGRGSLDRVIELTAGLILMGILPIEAITNRLINLGARDAKDRPS